MDLAWLGAGGSELTDADWGEKSSRSIGVFLKGDAIDDVDAGGEPVTDDSFLLLFNADHEPVRFVLPESSFGECWTPVLNTADVDEDAWDRELKACEATVLEARSVVVLKRVVRIVP